MGCTPKWFAAGLPIIMVMFENLTTVPPRTQIVSGEGFPKGAPLPLPVTKAIPLTTNPSVDAGLNAGQLVAQSVDTMPSDMLMWCV